MGWLVNVDLPARERKGSERLLKGFDERYNNLGNGRRLLLSLNLAICMGLFTVIARNDVIGCYFLYGRALSPASKCELQCKHSSWVLVCVHAACRNNHGQQKDREGWRCPWMLVSSSL